MTDLGQAVSASYLGIPVSKSPNLDWDQVIATPDRIWVGEIGHLIHHITLGNLLSLMRNDLEQMVRAFEKRVDDGFTN